MGFSASSFCDFFVSGLRPKSSISAFRLQTNLPVIPARSSSPCHLSVLIKISFRLGGNCLVCSLLHLSPQNWGLASLQTMNPQTSRTGANRATHREEGVKANPELKRVKG